ncbi:MAG: dipicolinate synthase subunit DpsA [Clostridiales bacterium]|nr:dipicolinate synthase subunit DpsA [Clostridiales bacterium]
MNDLLTFSVIGGDQRQVELIHILLDKGHRVNILGFDELIDSKAKVWTKVEPALFNCNLLLLPIPYRNEQGNITIQKSGISVRLSDIAESLGNYRPFIILGKADKSFSELAHKKELHYFDIVEDETFAILNAIPTAEGAIQKAMEMTNFTLHGSNILILGYGRIGRSLSRMLKGIGAKVTVEARKTEDLAWISENGYTALHLDDLDRCLPFQDIIFNTVPHLILEETSLGRLNKNTIIIDISSYPGGVDFAAAQELGIEACLSLGLPGKVAPKSAAEIIYKVIMGNVREGKVKF